MNPIWMLARGSGVAAYVLLSAATVWGLLLASKVLDRSASARGLTWVHESLSLAAVASTAVHMVSLWLEEFIDFDLRHLLIPGASTFRPVPVALGVVAFWALAVITPSFYLRHKIGQRAWRALHFATFGCFLAAALHGITAGTDTGRPTMVVLYATTLTAVLGLIVLRLVKAGASSSRREAAGGTAPAETAASGAATPPGKPRIPPELLERSSVTAPDEAQATDAPAPPTKPRIPPELLERSRARASADR
jgi:predicted ferric reductase